MKTAFSNPSKTATVGKGTGVQVSLPPNQIPAERRRSVKELPFFGMWADRTDIGTGVNYVDKLRKNSGR